jgi:tRNA(fMet)-specific endonuclease VapC
VFFLDTNSCIYFLNGKYGNIRKRLLSTSPNEIKISSIVKAELLLGAEKSKAKETTLEKLERFLDPFEIVPFDDQVSYVYAQVRGVTESLGKIVGPNDLLIASTVIFYEGILITNNTKEFEVISELRLENWI